MKIGFCLSPDTASAWPDYPGDYLEVNVQQHLQPEADDTTFATTRSQFGCLDRPILAANCFLPGSLRIVGPDADLPRLERYARVAFRRAAEVGIRHIVLGSAGARRVPENGSRAEAFDQFVTALRLLGPLAAEHNVVIVIEPLNTGECNLLNTVAEGALAVARADHPHVRLLVDLFHMLRNGETPASLHPVGPLIAHAHIAEVAERTAPGVAGDDFRPFLRALREVGYAGDLSVECNWKTHPHAEAVAAVAELHRQLAA